MQFFVLKLAKSQETKALYSDTGFLIQLHKKDFLYLKENYFGNDNFTCQVTNHKDFSNRMHLSAAVSQ